MIIDKIENYKLYEGIGKRIAASLKYLYETNLTDIELGVHKIYGDDIFAIVDEYHTKNERDARLESHFKYIDIQYIISGTELIGATLLESQVPVEKNEKKDYAFYDGSSSMVEMKQGMFAIFFPTDLHLPGIKVNQSSFVKKLVMKVRI